MIEGEIALRFIRAAEIDRATREHVGPAPLRAQRLPYVHDIEDKRNWRKEAGDKLVETADPYAEERKRFWERMGLMPTAQELADLEGLYDLLMMVERDDERRALLAWSRAKAGGKAFRRWCFQVEGIHPETGRRRKDRALRKICLRLSRKPSLDSEIVSGGVLQSGPEFGHLSITLDEDVGRREGLDNWAADDAFSPFIVGVKEDFSWAEKRNERRRKRDAAKRKQAQNG